MLKRWMPPVLLGSGLIAFFAFDLDRFLSLEALAEHRGWLLAHVHAYPLLAPVIYIMLYIAVVAFSLPGGTVMTLAGGFLFGALAGGMYAVVGASVGATVLFLLARTSLGDYLLHRAGTSIRGMQQGFAGDALSYMFVLRLVPLFPFFLVNLAPAFLGVPLRTYVIATFFGIMPATFIYALAGAGLGEVLSAGDGVSPGGIMTPQMIGALVGLALLALLPVIYRRRLAASEAASGGSE